MIGNLYFVVKSTVITFVIVCLLQIQFQNRSLETRLMSFVRTTLAPQVLGSNDKKINHSDFTINPKEMNALKKRIFESDAFKGVGKSAKAVFIKEMEKVMNSKDEKSDEKKNN